MEVARAALKPLLQGCVQVAREPRLSLSVYYELHDLVALKNGGPVERWVWVMGCAAWYPLMLQLREEWAQRQSSTGLQVLVLDNIGIGRSSCPADPKLYTTTAMAYDALAVADHVGWDKFHVAGFSMGGMISTKLASLAPDRVQSLVAMSVTGGGLQVIPRRWKGWKYAVMGLRARGADERARVDIKFHFSKATRRRVVPALGRTVAELLREEYVRESQQGGAQQPAGQKGQAHAVWTHSVTDTDVKNILAAGFPVWYLHGRADVLATPRFAEALAKRCHAPCVFVAGAHFIPRENAAEVAALLAVVAEEAHSGGCWGCGRALQVSLQAAAGAHCALGSPQGGGGAVTEGEELKPLAQRVGLLTGL